MSDKYGRKPLLVFSLIGTAASFLMMAFAPSAIFLFLARALDGVTAGNIPVVSAVISDSTEGKDRARGFGIIGAAFGFGFVFGPGISAFTVGINPMFPFLIAAVMTTIAIILTAVLLPETNKHIGQVEDKKLFDFKKLAASLFDPNIGRTLLVTLLVAFAFGMFIYAYQPFSVKVLNLNPTQISTNFVIFGIVGLISQLVLIPRITKKFGDLKSFVSAIFLLAISMTLIYFTPGLIYFMVVSVALSLGNSFIMPLVQTLLSKEVDAKSQGTIMGVNASYNSLGFIFGPIAGGLIATYSLEAPFLAGGIVSFAALAVATHIFLTSRTKKVSEF